MGHKRLGKRFPDRDDCLNFNEADIRKALC